MKALKDVFLHENNNNNINSNEKLIDFTKIKNRSNFSNDIYFMEKPLDCKMNLCCHGRVAIDSIFKGEIKAVILILKSQKKIYIKKKRIFFNF